MQKQGISIWFFVGISLAVNGVLIFAAGVHDLLSPPAPEHQVVLQNLHASLWWGALMGIVGVIYLWKCRPARERRAGDAATARSSDERTKPDSSSAMGIEGTVWRS